MIVQVIAVLAVIAMTATSAWYLGYNAGRTDTEYRIRSEQRRPDVDRIKDDEW